MQLDSPGTSMRAYTSDIHLRRNEGEREGGRKREREGVRDRWKGRILTKRRILALVNRICVIVITATLSAGIQPLVVAVQPEICWLG